MKKFNISVNGNSYEVEVDEIKDGSVAPAPRAQAAPAAAPKAAAPASAPKATPKKAGPAGAGAVKSPMPGTIHDVKVSEGQAVKAGDVLVILEAMKMENEIMAPKDGTVKSVNVSKGASVAAGDVLVVVE